MKYVLRIPSALILGACLLSCVGLSWGASQNEDPSLTTHRAIPFFKVSSEQNTYQGLSFKEQQKVSSSFGLSPKEYAQYLYYMHETPDRFYYAKESTNPLWVLAAHSEHSPVLFKKYIKQSVEISYAETSRMLKVQNAFVAEAHRLYPHQMAVMTPQMRYGHLRPSDVIRLFCSVGSSSCSAVLGKLIPKIQKSTGARLDLFLVGATKKSQIEHFARVNQIPMSLVQKGVITLNYGDRAFQDQMGQAHSKQALATPYASLIRGGVQIPFSFLTGGDHAGS